MQMQSYLIPRLPVRRAIAISAVLHALLVAIVWWGFAPGRRDRPTLVDIELAPPVPAVEALPEEVVRERERRADEAKQAEEQTAANAVPAPPAEGTVVADAGVDAARPDAAVPDAAVPDAAVPDAPVDAGGPGDAPLVAESAGDAGTGDGGVGDAGPGDVVALGSGSGAGSSTGDGSGSAPGGTGMTSDPAIDGAPTSPGTAANLLAYFPAGHVVTVLVRFDRMRGSEWIALTERLLRPLPDYALMFGTRDARLGDKLETIIISTPNPSDPAVTTVIGRTRLGRGALRTLLETAAPVTWSPARGGLLGRRSRVFRGDSRVFLSPFRGWFVLASRRDLPGMLAPVKGNPDTIEAAPPLPPWLAGIRAIETETGTDVTGPALVITMDPGGGRAELGPINFGLGSSVPLPERVSLALELVNQGWVVRGNVRFASEAEAIEFQQIAEAAQKQVGTNWMFQRVVGAPAVRLIQNLAFVRGGQRLSYSTSISIADMRALMTVASAHLEVRFKGAVVAP